MRSFWCGLCALLSRISDFLAEGTGRGSPFLKIRGFPKEGTLLDNLLLENE